MNNLPNDAAIIKLGLDDAGVPAPAKRTEQALQAIGKTAEVSARQSANAMRQLPAQFTDVATQLAGGQNPLLVLLQQGGQIKDSFGGIGPALRGVASAISPVALAVGGAVGLVAALGAAYSRASGEQTAFERSLALTGNRLGLTSDQLQQMAANVGRITGNRGEAAAALITISETGAVASRDLERVTAAAVEMERLGGAAVEQTAKAFERLAKDPAAATRELGAQLGYLTPQLYDSVQALLQQGRQMDAVRVAQGAYTQALEQVNGKLRENLGLWSRIKQAASDAWDATVEPLREPTLVERLAAINRRLELKAQGVVTRDPVDGAELLNQRDRLSRDVLRAQERGDEVGTAREVAQAYATARDEVQKLVAAGLTGEQKLEAALKKLRANIELIRGQGGAVSAADQLTAERALRADFLGKGQSKAAPREVPGPDRRDAEYNALFRRAVPGPDERDQKFNEEFKRREKAADEYIQNARDANLRASAELLQDERLKGEALIRLDKELAQRRLDALGLTGTARETAQGLLDQQTAIRERQLQLDLRKTADRTAEEAGRTVFEETRNALSAAFRDAQGNPLRAFGNALANTLFTRATASLVDALATAAVGRNGRGGLLGDLLSGLSIFGGSGDAKLASDAAGVNAALPGFSSGIDYVPRNMVARIHEGEAVVPKKYNPAAGGAGGASVQVTQHFHVDARADRQALMADMVNITAQSQQALVEELRARGAIA